MGNNVPVYFINLDRSAERLEFIRGQLEAAGITAQRIAGTDGRGNVPERFRAQFASCEKLTGGEVGCYVSHLRAYEAVMAAGQPAALILEDDVSLGHDFYGVACEAIASAPEGWDLIHLSTHFKNACIKLTPLGRDHHLIEYRRYPAGSAAYAISASGCNKLLRLAQRQRPIDMEFRYPWVTGLQILGVYPSPASPTLTFRTSVDACGLASARKRGYWAPSYFLQAKHAIMRQLCWPRRRFRGLSAGRAVRGGGLV